MALAWAASIRTQVARRTSRTWIQVRFGLAERISATAPATVGVEWLVPPKLTA
jgi:hypothetical protein